MVVEETNIVFHTTSLQFSIFQLSKIQWAGSVPWRIIAFDRVLIEC